MFLVCGEALLDVFAEERGEGLHFDARVGGSPFNVAVGLARLEMDVGLFAVLSDDFLGLRLRSTLISEGVAEKHLVLKDAPTTLAFVSVGADGGADYSFYGNGAADRSLTVADLRFLGPDISGLHASSYSLVADPTGETLLTLFRREKGKRLLSLDPNVRLTVEPDRDLWRRRIADFVAFADVIKISWEDVDALYPGATPDSLAQDWLSDGVRLIVFTFGADGALALSAKARAQVPGQSIDTVVDTVGAGDTFQAALIFGLQSPAREFGSLDADDLTGILDFAARAAAITCSRRGHAKAGGLDGRRLRGPGRHGSTARKSRRIIGGLAGGQISLAIFAREKKYWCIVCSGDGGSVRKVGDVKIRNMDEFAVVSGVSRPTISKYFHDPDSVRASTRRRIETALERYDYRPNIFAVNQNRKLTKNLGIVVPNLADPFFAEIARNIEQLCIELGYRPVLFSSHGNRKLEVEILDNLRSLKPAGVLLAPLGRISDRAEIAKFCADVPTVLFDGEIPEQGLAYVGSDNPQFATLIVDYLCRTGEPPCFFEMKDPSNPNANKRREGYMSAMSSLGHAPHIVRAEGEGWNFEEIGRREGGRALDARRFTTNTVLCSNDRLAIGFLTACFERRIRVGRDAECTIRVAGQDDHPFSRFTCPPLTTVAQDYNAISRHAVETLFKAIKCGTTDYGTKLFAGRLIVRESA